MSFIMKISHYLLLFITPYSKQRRLPPNSPPPIRSPKQIPTPTHNPPPSPQKRLCHLPPLRIPRIPPDNNPRLTQRIARPFPRRIRPIPTQIPTKPHIIIRLPRQNQILAHPHNRQQIQPRMMRDLSLEGTRTQRGREERDVPEWCIRLDGPRGAELREGIVVHFSGGVAQHVDVGVEGAQEVYAFEG